jgi:hypothetical protein
VEVVKEVFGEVARVVELINPEQGPEEGDGTEEGQEEEEYEHEHDREPNLNLKSRNLPTPVQTCCL